MNRNIIIYDLDESDIKKYKNQLKLCSAYYKFLTTDNLSKILNKYNIKNQVIIKNLNSNNNSALLCFFTELSKDEHKNTNIVILTKNDDFYSELSNLSIKIFHLRHLEEFSCKNIFQNAYSYYLLVIYAYQNYLQHNNLSLTIDVQESIIVNLCLCCELLLKTLLANGNNSVKGHQLFALVNNLDENLKNDIVTQLAQKQNCEICEIIVYLNNISNYFADIRYWNENIISEKTRDKDYNAIPFLKNFADILIEKNRKLLDITDDIHIVRDFNSF